MVLVQLAGMPCLFSARVYTGSCTSNFGVAAGFQNDTPGNSSAMLDWSAVGIEYCSVRVPVVLDAACLKTVKSAAKSAFARDTGRRNSSQSPAGDTGAATIPFSASHAPAAAAATGVGAMNAFTCLR